MLIKDVKKKINEGTATQLLKHGFIFNKGRNEFKRVTNGVQQIFDLLFYKESNGSILIEPHIRIKIKDIEDIYHKASMKEAKYNDATITLGNNLGEIIQYYDKGHEEGGEYINMKYLIENENDVDTLIKVIPERFEQYALPYFESNNSIAEVDKLLNENPRELSIHNLIYPIRACIGLIAAKLNHNPDFNRLVTIYDEELIDANPINKEEFIRVKTLLCRSS